MYHQVRAPSSCSAPPDLLLVSDRENNIPLISTTTPTNGHQKQHHQHQQHHHHKDIISKNCQNARISENSNTKNNGNSKLANVTGTVNHHNNDVAIDQQHQNSQQPNPNHHQSKDERIHLEVSLIIIFTKLYD